MYCIGLDGFGQVVESTTISRNDSIVVIFQVHIGVQKGRPANAGGVGTMEFVYYQGICHEKRKKPQKRHEPYEMRALAGNTL